MTNMEHALTVAGVKLPSQKQRIWQWLRDKGPHSVKDMHVELKIGEPTVQAAVTDLIKRKMLRTLPRTDHKGIRLNNHYEALGRAFELLPLPLKGAAGRAAAAAKRIPAEDSHPLPATPTATPAAPDFSPEKFVDNLTLTQARQVYQYLGKMFK